MPQPFHRMTTGTELMTRFALLNLFLLGFLLLRLATIVPAQATMLRPNGLGQQTNLLDTGTVTRRVCLR